jgi:ATP-dependent Clp protease ATP-binding subunit ClpC
VFRCAILSAVFAGFTASATETVNLAEREAAELGAGYIGAEHILLGLLGQEPGLGGQILLSFGFSDDSVRRRLRSSSGAAQRGPADMPSPGRFERHGRPLVRFKFTPRARAILERAVTEALVLGSGSIGSEHILLGLSVQDGSLAMQILDDLDAELPRSDDERLDRELALELRNAAIRAITTSGGADHSTIT